jgi:CheY-like chemotaxis protein
VTHHILYVEDDPTNRQLMATIFEDESEFGLVMANSATDAQSITQRQSFDLVVTDIKLGDMDGYQVLKNVRHSNMSRAVPVIAVTAAAMPDDIERGREAGFDDYITKPINIKSLVNKVRKCCNES